MVYKPIFRALVVLLLYAACATAERTGPAVSRAEMREAERHVALRSVRRLLGHQTRVEAVANRLLAALLPDSSLAVHPYAGFRLAEAGNDTALLAEALGIPRPSYPFVYSLDPAGPAAEAGVHAGDEVIALDAVPIASARQLNQRLLGGYTSQGVNLTVRRHGSSRTISFQLESRPAGLVVSVIPDRATVNAFAGDGGIGLTTGLLAFVYNDDELATVVSHEIAHVVLGHLRKQQGNAVKMALGILAVAIAGELIESGAGESIVDVGSYVGRGFAAGFSRDFEREADTFGLELAHRAGYDPAAGFDFWERFAAELPESVGEDLFATHPSSLERLVRAKKIALDLGAGGAGSDVEHDASREASRDSIQGGKSKTYLDPRPDTGSAQDGSETPVSDTATPTRSSEAFADSSDAALVGMRRELEASLQELDKLHEHIVRIREQHAARTASAADLYAYPKLIERQNRLADEHNAKMRLYNRWIAEREQFRDGGGPGEQRGPLGRAEPTDDR